MSAQVRPPLVPDLRPYRWQTYGKRPDSPLNDYIYFVSALVPDGFNAPEAAGSDYTPSRDIYSLGILVLTLVLSQGKAPAPAAQLRNPLIKQDRELHDFLSKCLHE